MKINKKIIEELVGYLKEFNLNEIEYSEGTTKVKVSRSTNNSNIISTETGKKKSIIEENNNTFTEIKQKVRELIGPHASPDKIQFTPALPKTRSGKIMRRILRKIAEGDTNNLGDISTLADPNVVENLVEGKQ